MALAFEQNKLPVVLPASVARTEPDGRPTTALIENEFLSRQWYLNNAVDMETRLTSVKSQTDGNTAAITTETQARTDGDSALASQITTLDAQVDGNTAAISAETTARVNGDNSLGSSIQTVDAKFASNTATGGMEFRSLATPTGATAAFGLFVRAGSATGAGAYTGMQMFANSDGTGGIILNANSLQFNDSGTRTNVFSYSAGVFNFNVPVTIRNQDIAVGAVSNESGATSPSGPNPSASCTITVRDGARVHIKTSYIPSGAGAVSATAGQLSVTGSGGLGTMATTGVNYTTNAVTAPSGGGPCAITWLPANTAISIYTAPLAAGTYTITAATSGTGVHGLVTVSAIALYR